MAMRVKHKKWDSKAAFDAPRKSLYSVYSDLAREGAICPPQKGGCELLASQENLGSSINHRLMQNSKPATDPVAFVGRLLTVPGITGAHTHDPEARIDRYNARTGRWKLTWDPLWAETSGSAAVPPPVWVSARWMKRYGPPDLCPPGYDRSRSDDLVAEYLASAAPERAWFLSERSTGQVQRWHARSVCSSDFAVVRGKCGAALGAQLCPCGAGAESSEHVYLHCPIFAAARQFLENKMDRWVRRLRRTEAATGAWAAASRADVLHWAGPPRQPAGL